MLGQEDLEKSLGGVENMFVSVSHLLITLNCSANFTIYCYKVQNLSSSTKYQCRFSSYLGHEVQGMLFQHH